MNIFLLSVFLCEAISAQFTITPIARCLGTCAPGTFTPVAPTGDPRTKTEVIIRTEYTTEFTQRTVVSQVTTSVIPGPPIMSTTTLTSVVLSVTVVTVQTTVSLTITTSRDLTRYTFDDITEVVTVTQPTVIFTNTEETVRTARVTTTSTLFFRRTITRTATPIFTSILSTTTTALTTAGTTTTTSQLTMTVWSTSTFLTYVFIVPGQTITLSPNVYKSTQYTATSQVGFSTTMTFTVQTNTLSIAGTATQSVPIATTLPILTRLLTATASKFIGFQ